MKSIFTRRSMLRSGLAATISAVFPIHKLQGEADAQLSVPANTAIHHKGHKVSFYHSTDARYARLLDVHFPNIAAVSAYSEISHLSMIVVHRKGPPVVAYSVQWDLVLPNSILSSHQFHYSKPTSSLSSRGKRALSSGKRHVLRPNSITLITPSFSISSKQYAEHGVSRLSFRERGATQTLLRLSPKTTATSSHLDSVIFADHKIGGRNLSRLDKRFRLRRNGEHDLSKHLLKCLSEGASVEDLNRQLTVELSKHTTNGKESQLWYESSRRLYAKMLHKVLKKHGVTSFTQIISRTGSERKTKVTRLTA